MGRYDPCNTKGVHSLAEQSNVNRNTARFVVLLIVIATTLALFRQDAGQAQPQVSPRTKEKSHRQLVGAASCSASVCHGGADLGHPRSEATTWRALDPHAHAYDSLLMPQSQAIARHLFGDGTQAHDAPLCLKCHVHPHHDQARPNFRKADGVSCESCHGAAGEWLTPHYRSGWQQADKKAHGMSDTKSLPGRASVCVTCHVGTPDANVDHDMIAAGHPPLRFEFTSYFANLPPHWDVAKDRKVNEPDDVSRLHAWALGQDVSAATAAELLAYRADAKNGKLWPEFAELDCFACHHDLHAKSSRQSKEHLQTRRPGKLMLNNWYFAMSWLTLPDVGEVTRVPVATPEFDPIKDRARILEMAQKTTTKRREMVRVRQPNAQQHVMLKQVEKLVSMRKDDISFDDFSAQLYLAMLAAVPQREDELTERLRRGLKFPMGYNSPRR